MLLSNIFPQQARQLLLPLALALSSTVAAAQAPAADTPASGVLTLAAALQYQSPLKNYHRYDDQTVQPWREANDRVGQIGGWRTYAKEAVGKTTGGETSINDVHSNHHGGATK